MIYILKLTEGNIFIYCSTEIIQKPNIYAYKTDSQIMLEAELYYDYLKKYKPVSIMKKMQLVNIFDIDTYVKLYMIEYGVDHVRGGTYYQEFLPSHLEKTLLNELETACDEIKPIHQNVIYEIIDDYANRQMTKDEIQKEKSLLTEKYNNYLKEKTEYENIQINSSQIFDEIEWIKNVCLQNIEAYNSNKQLAYLRKIIKKENIEIYRNIILDLKRVREIYDTFNKPTENNVFVKYPQFLFDDFFYHWHNIHISKYVTEIDRVCKAYEYMTTVIVNRMDEKRFDISTWGKNVEWKTPRALYLLDKIEG